MIFCARCHASANYSDWFIYYDEAGWNMFAISSLLDQEVYGKWYILEYTVVILLLYVEIGFHDNGSSNSSL